MITENDFGEKVLYYIHKGEHRKRVNTNVIKKFENIKLYFLINDFKKVKKFILANSGESQTELENTFQKNFNDNFIEGESVFFISY